MYAMQYSKVHNRKKHQKSETLGKTDKSVKERKKSAKALRVPATPWSLRTIGCEI
jgi:hypothetical protein